MTADNIILDKGGTNQITIYTILVEEIINKKITEIDPPQSSANWSSGPKTSKLVDLLRTNERFAVTGLINKSDKSKMKNIINTGGVLVMEWEDEDFNVNLDKETITTDDREDDHKQVQFTCVVGEDI